MGRWRGRGRAATGEAARSERTLRRTARRLLRELNVDPPLEVETLRRSLETTRGRPLHLIPHAFPDTSTVGLLIQTSAADLVYFEQDFTPEQQRRTVLHEFGHLVLEHSPRDGGEVTEAVWRSVAPTLPREVVVKVLCRSAHDNPPEVEAEVFASVLLAWRSPAPLRTARAPLSGRSTDLVDGCETTIYPGWVGTVQLGAQMGWCWGRRGQRLSGPPSWRRSSGGSSSSWSGCSARRRACSAMRAWSLAATS